MVSLEFELHKHQELHQVQHLAQVLIFQVSKYTYLGFLILTEFGTFEDDKPD